MGGTSIAGAIRLETDKSTFSSWAQKIGDLFKNTGSSSSSTTSQDSVTPALQEAGKKIGEVAKNHVWPFLQGSFAAFTSLKTTYTDVLGGVKNFFTSIVDPEILYRIFENLHIKLWQVTSFFFNTGKSSDFIGLFKGDQWDSTLKVAKFLLGLPVAGNGNFRAKHNVFNYLILKWMENPEKITKKFKSLSESIKDLTGSSNGGGGGGGESSSWLSGSGIYELEIPTLDQFLNIEKQWKENTWKWFWAGEVVAKIKGGVDVVGGARSWLFNWLGS